MIQIRCVAFDAVGTLIYPDPPVAHVYARVGRAHGSHLVQADVANRFRLAFQRAELDGWQSEHGGDPPIHLPASEEGERERWRRIVSDVLDDVNEPDACFESLFAHFGRPEAWRCYDDVAGTLSELRARGYRLFVASNFDKRLHSVKSGLEELRSIDGWIISSLVRCRKPCRQFYELLLEQAACRSDELLMVGDSYENDIVGAQCAGITAVQLNRSTTAVGSPAASEISSLTDVVERLAAAAIKGGFTVECTSRTTRDDRE